MSIWDSLHRGLEKASKEAARMGRIRYLRSTIEQLKRDFSQQESGLVARTRELYETGQLHQSELMPFCEALASLQQQLSEAQRELQSVQSGSEATARGQTDIITSYPVPEPGTLPAWAPLGSGGEREPTASSHPLYSPGIEEESATQIAPPPPPPPLGGAPFAPPLSGAAYPTIPTPSVGSSPMHPTIPASPLTPVHQDEGGVSGPDEIAAASGSATAPPLSGSLCPSCKANMPPGVRFCTRCGQALATVARPGPSFAPEPGLTQQPTIATPPAAAPATAIDPASISNQETVLQPPPGQPAQGGSPDAPSSTGDPQEGCP
ncbi:zinc ribbon domain-containing protein [Thermogemmatispora carboxidivorans]|uniref:zinc ribbon domain-containing protein n=1 Tax=Thermogemmatispora carboxidivorans TaxID=1382306 RepID=UPI00069C361E|nr:zinc ribbon domain-containing protein [Thermogemmatispora carboxidivorans]